VSVCLNSFNARANASTNARIAPLTNGADADGEVRRMGGANPVMINPYIAW
jgi:hypothetical protein